MSQYKIIGVSTIGGNITHNPFNNVACKIITFERLGNNSDESIISLVFRNPEYNDNRVFGKNISSGIGYYISFRVPNEVIFELGRYYYLYYDKENFQGVCLDDKGSGVIGGIETKLGYLADPHVV